MALTPQQLQALYDVHKRRVYTTALHYVQQVEEAEEITQDVFVKVFQSYDQFQHQSALSTWMVRITINLCLDHLKKRKTKKHFFTLGTKTDNEWLYHNTPDAEHPAYSLEQKEALQKMMAAIHQLTEQQQTAFILSKLDGLPQAEVADIMELSVPAVESLVFRAKTQLQKILAKDYPERHKKK